MLFFLLHPRVSTLSALSPACCCLACTWNLPLFRTFYFFHCIIPFCVRSHPVWFSETFLKLVFFNWHWLFITSFILGNVYYNILKSIVFIKKITMKMPRKHTLSTPSLAGFNHLIRICWSVLSLVYVINVMAGPCTKWRGKCCPLLTSGMYIITQRLVGGTTVKEQVCNMVQCLFFISFSFP